MIIQLLRDAAADYAGVIFVPTRIGHLSYCRGHDTPRYARARLLSRGPRAFSAEFEIFDDEQQPIAVLKQVRFRSIALHRDTAEPIRNLEYRAVPRPSTQAARAVQSFPIDRLAAELRQCFAADPVERVQRQYAQEIDPLLDALCSRYLTEALEQMPALIAGVPRNPRSTRALVRGSARRRAVRWQRIRLQPGAPEAPPSAQQIWRSLLGDYPDHSQIVHAVGCVGLHLAALLEGRRALAEIWPSQISMATLLRQVLGTELNVRIAVALREQIAAALHALPEGARSACSRSVKGHRHGRWNCARRSTSIAPITVSSPRAVQPRGGASAARKVSGVRRWRARCAKRRQCSRQLAIVTLDFRTLRSALSAIDYAQAQLAPAAHSSS